MSRASQLEVKVGGFVLLAVGALFFVIASISDFSFMEKGRIMQAVFNFANGLKEAAPVRVAGVEAGLVKKMLIFSDQSDRGRIKVRVHMWIKEGVRVPVDSSATINQLGLLGEKYVEIRPGESAEALGENGVMATSDPVAIEKITERVNVVMQQMEVTVDRINNGVLSARNQQSLEGILANAHDVTGIIKQGKGTIGKLLMDDGVYQNLEELTVDLKANPWKLLYRPRK